MTLLIVYFSTLFVYSVGATSLKKYLTEIRTCLLSGDSGGHLELLGPEFWVCLRGCELGALPIWCRRCQGRLKKRKRMHTLNQCTSFVSHNSFTYCRMLPCAWASKFCLRFVSSTVGITGQCVVVSPTSSSGTPPLEDTR